MRDALEFSEPPFDELTPEQQQWVRAHGEVVRFDAAAVIQDAGVAPAHLLTLIEGRVAQYQGDERVAEYGPGERLDARGLLTGLPGSRFVATQAVTAFALARPAVNALIAANAGFAAQLFSELGARLGAAPRQQDAGELQALNLARVIDVPLSPAVLVDADVDVLSVVRRFRENQCSSVLVRDTADAATSRLGMFTATALQQAVLCGTPLTELPVGRLASYPLITVNADDQVGDALLLMLRHDIHRVVVMEGQAIRGVLESLDMFSFLANHSHLIATRIRQAGGLDELAAAAGQITAMIGRQYRAGTRVPLIAHLVGELNAQLFDRAWRLIAPPELVANSCLFVMGSEGRGEQLLRTDQDNGLILRDAYLPPDDLAAICQRFSDALARFGYPECPGGIMLSRPDWRASASDFSRRVRQWLLLPESDSLMNLAIFMDAHAVSGDAGLLEQVRASLYALATDNDAVLARFAAAIDAFGGRTGWWNRLLGDAGQRLNLKKEGIFALVHGVRALALAQRLPETGTAARIGALVRGNELSEADGHELTEALHFLMELRLKGGLAELERGLPVSGAIDVPALPAHERERLKSTLAVVRKFKTVLRHRFRLDAL